MYGVKKRVFIITGPHILLTEDSKMVSGEFGDHYINHNLENAGIPRICCFERLAQFRRKILQQGRLVFLSH
jgi:hypothetical protein